MRQIEFTQEEEINGVIYPVGEKLKVSDMLASKLVNKGSAKLVSEKKQGEAKK